MSQEEPIQLDISYEQGRLKLAIWDLIQYLSDEEKAQLAADFAWYSPAWEEIKRAVKEDWAGHCVDNDIHQLRLAFLQSEEAPKQTKRVIQELLDTILHTEQKLKAREKAYDELWNIWRNIYGRGPDVHVPYEKFQYSTDQEVVNFLKAHGIEL